MISTRCRVTALTFLLAVAANSFTLRAMPARYEFSQVHMGTRFKIVLYGQDAESAERASNSAFKRIAQLDSIMSDYRETSELRSLCRKAGGQWVKVSDDLFHIITISQKFAERTNGAFDITVGPLVRLWRHARRARELPDKERLAAALRLVGYQKIHIDEKDQSVRLDEPGMMLDLGGIAKGYAADEAMAVLKQQGIRSALVAAGGDIVVSEPPPGVEGWIIGINSVDSAEKAAACFLSLKHSAVSTSGDAEQFVEIGGIRYSHIVDPRTGVGIIGHSSVTVVAPNGTTSDAMATAISVLGPKSGLRFVENIPGTAALMVQKNGQRFHTFESKRWKEVPKSAGTQEN